MLTVTPRRRRRIPHALAAIAAALLCSAILWHASQDSALVEGTRAGVENSETGQYSVLVDLGLMILGR